MSRCSNMLHIAEAQLDPPLMNAPTVVARVLDERLEDHVKCGDT